ncbi:MAG: tetratricopeptide repeat protein [Chamaesiphon sp.]
MQDISNPKKYHRLDIVEILSVVGSVGGSIASVVTQQVAFASVPLSLAVTLNLLNRRHLLNSIQQSNQTAIAQLVQDKGETQAKLETTTEQIAALQQLTTGLGKETSNLQDYTQNLRKEQTKIATMVGCLREIETYSQAIRINPHYASGYYNQGVTHQRLGDKEAAICDYSDAIRLDPMYTDAYYNRGLMRVEVGDKKGAVEDLREAAKLFFEQGNIANYQKARDLSKKLHELNSQAPESIAVKSLFS